MPNGEGTSDPRYAQAENWKALLLGMLAGGVMKSFETAEIDIVEVDAEEGHFMMQTPDGNWKVKIEVSF